MKTLTKFLSIVLLAIVLLLNSCNLSFTKPHQTGPVDFEAIIGVQENVCGAHPKLFEMVNNNKPFFTEDDYKKAEKQYQTGTVYYLSPLDALGRTGVTWGLFDYAHMPTYNRETLNTNPSGWKQHKYPSTLVPGGWVYNRAHQLGFQISGLQDEKLNLMTGTRDFNAGQNGSMLTWENMVADHLREFRKHKILYRVTPYFQGNNALAHGVLMEADCIQCNDMDYCVYVRNQQPGIIFDYTTGINWQEGSK